MGVKLQNNSDVQVHVYVHNRRVHSLKSGDFVNSSIIPHSLLGLRLETEVACKKPIYVEFTSHRKKILFNHIFGEIGHPGFGDG